jgi:catechol 2,3-dioxygenase-like lactoylglutathione lyase family enzyme
MSEAGLEHVNITSMTPKRTAEMMCSVFGWRVRWQGPSLLGGETIHVGTDDAYVAIYTPPASDPEAASRRARGRLNHIGVVVSDLETVERRVREAGYTPYSHADYEPGRRFYFRDDDGVEFEVVSYS